MRVPDEIHQCVVFIGRESGTELEYGATGFVVLLSETEGSLDFRFRYLVTAGHVADAIEGGVFWVRANRKGSGVAEVEADTLWYRHPDEPKLDVAVCPLFLPNEFELRAIPRDMFLTKKILRDKNIGVGDEVFFTGLFSEIKGKARNIPIVRVGTLAMLPDELVPTKLGPTEAYLIEARSIGGISGSPAFVRQSISIAAGIYKWGTNIEEVVDAYSGTFYFLGLMHGHWDIDPRDINQPSPRFLEMGGVNWGIAIVIPATKILEVIDQPELTEMRKRLKEEAVRRRGLPKMDSKLQESIFTREDFEKALRKASRRVKPSGPEKGKS